MSPLPVSVESGGDFYTEAMDLWDWLHPLNENLAIKVPFLKPNGQDNLLVIDSLIKEDITINCTAVLSLNQVLLATKLGCRYISIFGGRIDDEGGESSDIISKATDLIGTFSLLNLSDNLKGVSKAKAYQDLIVGSIRGPKDVDRLISSVSDCPYDVIVTIPPEVLEKMTQHKNSQATSKQFEDDYVSVVTLKGLKDTQKALEISHPIVGD